MSTSTYRIFHHTLASALPLPELPRVGDQAEADLHFELGAASPRSLPTVEWKHQWRLPNGEITLCHASDADGHRLGFPRLADFMISSNGRKIRCLRWPEIPESSIRHLLLDQVLPRVVSHFRCSVLHASAVSLPSGAVAFLGDTGWGKSTLGLSFEDDGHRLLGDDALLIDARQRPPRAISSYAGARLWDDSLGALGGGAYAGKAVSHYSSKRRVVPAYGAHVEGRSEWHALRAIFLLDDPRAEEVARSVEVERVRGSRAVMALVAHCFHLDLKDRARVASQFDELAELVSGGCAFYQLSYPRDHQRLDEVRAAIVAAAR